MRAVLTSLALAAALAPPAPAQQATKLSTIITGFLADSGAKTAGLPWITGNALPVKWKTAKPVPATEQYLKNQGYTLQRSGLAQVKVGSQPASTTSIDVHGTDTGIQQVVVGFANDVGFEGSGPFEKALESDGITLTPLKCSKDKEGASYGNLVYAMKAPGKLASALWESWNCGQEGCGFSMTIVYRKSDLAQVECSTG